ncbi:MAG: hypothetical protein AAFX93_19400 [Verrucomicrobiota bacterium]
MRPETEVLNLMEQCLRQCERPSQPAGKRAAAAKIRGWLKAYGDRELNTPPQVDGEPASNRATVKK